jgi:hypothetical protein
MEILRGCVAELEGQLKKQEESDRPSVQKTPGSGLDHSFRSDALGSDQSKRWHWEAVWTAKSHTGQMQYYGPSFSLYFINEICSHLKHILQWDHLDVSFLPITASRVFASPASVSRRADITTMHHIKIYFGKTQLDIIRISPTPNIQIHSRNESLVIKQSLALPVFPKDSRTKFIPTQSSKISGPDQ